MSSILTNKSAMVALQTLKSINANLGQVQGEIATGKSISSAKDNSAVWAISDSLALGKSSVAVGQNAAETVADLLTDIKGKIVAAQESNVDRDKINADVTALKEQIESVVGAAQFNGLSLVDGGANVEVLSSLNRDAAGDVSSSNITVATQDLATGGYSAKDVFATGGGGETANGDAFSFSLDNGGVADALTIAVGTAFEAGDKVAVRVGDQVASYTLTQSDVDATTTDDLVAVGLKNAIDSLGIDGLEIDYDSGTPAELAFTNNGTQDVAVTGQFTDAGSGGLGALSTIDVSASGDHLAALGAIEGLIDTAIDAAASLGSSAGRLETQSDFISKLTDSFTSGIGSLVDADMEEASANLQALQVQQQLGVQALSITNQAPQSILSLFR